MGMPSDIAIFNEVFLLDLDIIDAERVAAAYKAGDHTEMGRIIAGAVDRNLKAKAEQFSKRAREVAAAAVGFRV